MTKDDRLIQYMMAGDTFVRCGQTCLTVPLGLYEVVDAGRMGWGLKPKQSVSDELVDIPGTVADDVFTDIEAFLARGPAYALCGLTHKRGYLLYGPPGSGKTSLGLMVARRFIERTGGVVMFVATAAQFYHGVAIMRDVEPGRPSLYLIEEADSIVNNTHCLSILDGELSIPGSVFVAMTNYKEELPPRISNRPGRFDRVIHVAAPSPDVQRAYLDRIFRRIGGFVTPATTAGIVTALLGLPVSMAHLREAFISHVLMGVPLAEVRRRFDEMAVEPAEDAERGGCDSNDYWSPDGE